MTRTIHDYKLCMLRPEFQFNLHTKTKTPAVEWKDSRTGYFRLCMMICPFFSLFHPSFNFFRSTSDSHHNKSNLINSLTNTSSNRIIPFTLVVDPEVVSFIKLFALSPHVHAPRPSDLFDLPNWLVLSSVNHHQPHRHQPILIHHSYFASNHQSLLHPL